MDDQKVIEDALRQFIDTHMDQDLVSAGCVKSIEVGEDSVRIAVELGFPADSFVDELREEIAGQLEEEIGLDDVDVEVTWKVQAHTVQKTLKPLENVKNIIAVASGKGGVGKSTTSANLAIALAKEGASVGLLDADIYGPSQPMMMGLKGKPETDGKMLQPMLSHGVKVMSIGFLIEEDSPMIWRGPMVTQALVQLLTETDWGQLDYLIIDLPPGTGDIQLTLAQKVPVAGAVIVTTPQDIALLDAKRALKMFEKVDVKVLGVVENMSVHVCTNCGHSEPIFGEHGGVDMAKQYGVRFLGALPLSMQIRQEVDGGKPTVAAQPDGPVGRIYREIARNTAAQLALSQKDYSGKFPNIVIENN